MQPLEIRPEIEALMKTYAEDPHNAEARKALLGHPKFLVDDLIHAFMEDHPALVGEHSAGLDVDIILVELLPQIATVRLIEMIYYTGDHNYIGDFIDSESYDETVKDRINDLDWPGQLIFLTHITASASGHYDACYAMQLVRDVVKWPQHVCFIPENFKSVNDMTDYEGGLNGWKQLVEMANNPPA